MHVNPLNQRRLMLGVETSEGMNRHIDRRPLQEPSAVVQPGAQELIVHGVDLGAEMR